MRGRLIFLLLLLSGCSLKEVIPKDITWAEKPGVEVAQVRVAASDYEQLYALLEEKVFKYFTRPLRIGFNNCRDYSGQNSDSEGKLLPQSGEDYAMNPLVGRQNIELVDLTDEMRALNDWQWRWQNQASMGQPSRAESSQVENWVPIARNKMLLADYIVSCKTLGIDMKPGTTVEVFVMQAGAGTVIYAGLTGAAVRLIDNRTGQIVAHWLGEEPFGGVDAYGKVLGFFGWVFVSAKAESGEKQALQHVIKNTYQVGTYSVLADCFGNRNADALIPNLFKGHRMKANAPCRDRMAREEQVVPFLPVAQEVKTPPARTTGSCPLEKPLVVAVFYKGHNNTTLDGTDPVQERTIAQIEDLQKKGCIVEIVEGARCPKPPAPGVMFARATKIADRLSRYGQRPQAIEMSRDKLSALHATCSKQKGCDEDAYPYFYAGYVTIVPPKNRPSM